MGHVYKESKQERYDVIVIGAGIGGLSTAALLAKAGRSVLLVERHDRPGGYAQGFTRKRFRFDAGVHLVSGCGSEGYAGGRIIHKICRAIGIVPEAHFIPLESFAHARYPDFDIAMASGEAQFIAGLAEQFPRERDNIRRLVNLCRLVSEEAMVADEVLERVRETRGSPAESMRNLFRYRRASVADVLDELLDDPRLKSACASLWPYLGKPPSELSFVLWAAMMAGYVSEGGFYCRGTFQRYADLLARHFKEIGGELLLNGSVRRILLDNGRAAGVVLENGQVIRAESVVSNADLRQTLDLMIGREHIPAGYCDQISRLNSSLSIFIVYLATDLPLPAGHTAHESFFFDSANHETAYVLTEAGNANWFSATVPTLADPTLLPAGQHLMLLTTLCPFDIGQSWRAAKPKFQAGLLERAEKHFPGLNGRLLHVESGTPRTLERFTLNHQGSAYGWAPTPDQIGPNRPQVQGSLPGLYFTGHWTRPGGGVAGVSVSAMLAAQAVLGIPRQFDFWCEMGLSGSD